MYQYPITWWSHVCRLGVYQHATDFMARLNNITFSQDVHVGLWKKSQIFDPDKGRNANRKCDMFQPNPFKEPPTVRNDVKALRATTRRELFSWNFSKGRSQCKVIAWPCGQACPATSVIRTVVLIQHGGHVLRDVIRPWTPFSTVTSTTQLIP